MRLKEKPNLLLAPSSARIQDLEDAIEFLTRGTSEDQLNHLGIDALDCCGTGGSGTKKFNYSTATAFILNAGGIKVAKFGNRSQTGNSGSCDFLSAIGIPSTKNKCDLETILTKNRLVFVNAQHFYPELKSLSSQRKRLGRPTILNYIGPLLNPLKPQFRLIGVSNLKMMNFLVDILSRNKSIEKAVLVNSYPNLDELSVNGLNHVVKLDNSKGTIESFEIDGQLFSQKQGSSIKADFSSTENAIIFKRILDGFDTKSTIYQNLVLNSAAGFLLMNKSNSIEEGICFAKKLIRNGQVKISFENTRRIVNEYA